MRLLLIIFLLCVFPATLFASEYQGNCAITFKGSSTLHDFDGKAKCQPFTVSVTDGVIDASKLSVAIADMDTDNSRRDNNMREMFEDKKFPLITGNAGAIALKELRGAQKKGADSSHKISFKLKIRDVVHPVTATVKNLVETDGHITADIHFTLSLAEFHLTPPSVLGMIKVDDKIEVKSSFVLNAAKH